MYGEAGPSKQSLVTNVAFEVFGLLMLYQNLLIVKLSVAIPNTFVKEHQIPLLTGQCKPRTIHAVHTGSTNDELALQVHSRNWLMP